MKVVIKSRNHAIQNVAIATKLLNMDLKDMKVIVCRTYEPLNLLLCHSLTQFMPIVILNCFVGIFKKSGFISL